MPKKGKSKNPLGPCMNVLCPSGLNADFRCGCPIENTGEHSIFHPECTASSEGDSTVVHRSAGSAAALAPGAQLHRALGLAEEGRIMCAKPPAEPTL